VEGIGLSDRNQALKEFIRYKLKERQSEAKVVRKIVLIVSVVFFLLFGGVIGGGYYYIKSALKPVDPDSKQEKKVTIPIGTSPSGIGVILEENGIIKDAKVFKYYVKFKNEAGFMAGDYQLKPSMTIPEVVASIKTGSVEQEVVFKIIVPEGKQLTQISDMIAEKTNRTHEEVFSELNDPAFIKKMIEKYPDILSDEILKKEILYPLEGYLFPATYPFYEENPTVEKIVITMLNKTRSVLEPFQNQMNEKNLSPHQLLTMASLVEEEATEKADRETIASVFYNRLKTSMPLQTDPTVLYAKGKHKEKVLYEDLKIDSPYNTYKNSGLPPGPIANAGTSSIEAALNPKETNYYYFLANAEGEVFFSETLEVHNQLKQKHITSNN
jgi:UPF0755 protein